MSDLRQLVERALRHRNATWSPEMEQMVARSGSASADWLLATSRLLHLAWRADSRDAAVAAAAVMEHALDVGPHGHTSRPSWVAHLWLAERTLSRCHGDYRLTGDVQRLLTEQARGRSSDDPVALAVAYLERPLPRRGVAIAPIEEHAARLAISLPPGDLGRCGLQVRLAQASAVRNESGDASALLPLCAWARSAHRAVTPDHLEVDLVERTVLYAALHWFRAHEGDYEAVGVTVAAGRTALAAVERQARLGVGQSRFDVAATHLMLARALMASLERCPGGLGPRPPSRACCGPGSRVQPNHMPPELPRSQGLAPCGARVP